MASMIQRILGFLGVREEPEFAVAEDEETEAVQEELYEEEEESEIEQPVNRPKRAGQRKGNLVSLSSGSKQVKVMIVEPIEFEEVRPLVDHLKNKDPVIVRLEKVEREEAKRMVDFMSGATYALDGNMRKLGDVIFFFAPYSVIIEGELESAMFDMRDSDT